jgi:mono/diheme cytochrome c family protein
MERISFKLVYCWAFIFSAAILLAGCVPDEEQSAAYKLYSAKCSSCHRLLPPEDYSLEKFGEYIEKYGKEMTPDEKTRLLDGLRAYKKLKEE